MGTFVNIEGNLTKDPELRFTPSGTAQVTFSVADNRKWTGADGQTHEETSFFDCVAWKDLGENIAESLHKGDRVIVIGQVRQRSWETDDGQKRSKVEVVVDGIGPSLRWATLAAGAIQRTGSKQPAMAGAPAAGGTDPVYDEEPF